MDFDDIAKYGARAILVLLILVIWAGVASFFVPLIGFWWTVFLLPVGSVGSVIMLAVVRFLCEIAT